MDKNPGSYEIIKKNISFKSPGRIGLDTKTFSNEFYDVIHVDTQADPAFKPKKASAVWRNYPNVLPPNTVSEDEWGSIWKSNDIGGVGTVVQSPLQIDDIDSFKTPDPFAEGRFGPLMEMLPIAEFDSKYLILDYAAPLFERMHFLLGFENLMMSLLAETKKIKLLAEKLTDFMCGLIENAYKSTGNKLDGIYLQDDLGTQQGLLMSLSVFKDIFKPGYKKIFEAAHKHGMDVWLHSDGKIHPFLEHLIEIGLDVFNIQQPDLMGIDEIASLIKGKVAIHCTADIQDTMHKTPKDVAGQVRNIIDKWNTEKGGLIAYDYGDPETIGIPEKNRETSFEAFMEFGGVNRQVGRKSRVNGA